MENENAKITSQRLRNALARKQMSQQDLVDRSGVSKASVSQYIHARNTPAHHNAFKMAAVLDVAPAWLMGFNVPMEQDIEKEKERIRREMLVDQWDFTDEELYLMDQIRRLNEDGYRKLEDYLKDLLEMDKYTEMERLI